MTEVDEQRRLEAQHTGVDTATLVFGLFALVLPGLGAVVGLVTLACWLAAFSRAEDEDRAMPVRSVVGGCLGLIALLWWGGFLLFVAF